MHLTTIRAVEKNTLRLQRIDDNLREKTGQHGMQDTDGSDTAMYMEMDTGSEPDSSQ
jgi:hypothetical protein